MRRMRAREKWNIGSVCVFEKTGEEDYLDPMGIYSKKPWLLHESAIRVFW